MQRATELPYQTCLRLVRCEIAYEPASEDCEVRRALLEATKGHYVQPDLRASPCPCVACDT